MRNKPFEISAGVERPVGDACNDDRLYRIVRRQPTSETGEFKRELPAERVQGRWPIELYYADIRCMVDKECSLTRHAFLTR